MAVPGNSGGAKDSWRRCFRSRAELPAGCSLRHYLLVRCWARRCGGAQQYFFPHLTGSAGTYALVGMGVLFAGFLRAPMTSVFMVLEVSGNYSIIVPVIIANTFAYVISRGLQPIPIFDLLTRQDGLELPSMEEQREEDILRVEDAMQTDGGSGAGCGEDVGPSAAEGGRVREANNCWCG